MSKPETQAGGASAPLLDLQRLVVSIRRRRRMWVAFGLLGLILGGLIALLMPPKPTAVARLLIVHEQDQPTDGGSLMRTDIAVMQTTRMAGLALRQLGSSERPEDFLLAYQSTGLTSNVLELSVEGTSDADAVAKAAALSEVFITDHVQRIQAAADADAQALLDQRDKTQTELNEVDAAIAAVPPTLDEDGEPTQPGQETAAQLETLYNRRAELTSVITDLSRQAEEAAIGAPRVAAGTQVVDEARALPRSIMVTGATNAGIGLVLGLVAGLTIAAVTSVVRDRPVLRREITANLGASVIAQLPANRRGLARLWRRKRALAQRKRVATTLVRSVRGIDSVSLLTLGATRVTVDLALEVAAQLVADAPLVVVDDLPKRDLRRNAVAAGGLFTIVDATDPVPPGRRQLGVGSVAPGTAWTDLELLGSQTVLIVRAGEGTTSWLHTVARQLADRQIPVIGVVLVDPDPKDHTDGTLWDGLHTALRGRVPKAGPATNGTNGTNGHASKKSNGEATEKLSPLANADLPTKRFAPVVKERDR
jgi:hypothetical protein